MASRLRTRKRVYAVRRAPDGSAFEKCNECGVMVAIALVDMHECGEKRREVKRFKGISGNKVDDVNLIINSFDDQPRSAFVFFMESFRKANQENGSIEVGRKGFEKWKNMSAEERQPYIDQATQVYAAYNRKLNDEANSIHKNGLLWSPERPQQVELSAAPTATAAITMNGCNNSILLWPLVNGIHKMAATGTSCYSLSIIYTNSRDPLLRKVDDGADSSMVGKFDKFYEGFNHKDNCELDYDSSDHSWY